MNYAIMRCKKLTSMGSAAASLQHCFRERETPNANAENTRLNIYGPQAKTTDEAMGNLRAKLPEKRRKDAVLAVEYLMTASPAWWKTATPAQQKDFFKQSYQWLTEKYGKDRVIAVAVHKDEQTPHLSAFVIPLTQDNRLSAKEFIGNKAKMTADQTSYAAAVAHLGLNRGIEGSRATHERVKSFYGSLDTEIRSPAIHAADLEPVLLKQEKGWLTTTTHHETQDDIAKRLTKKLQTETTPALKQAHRATQERRRALEAVSTSASLEKELKPFREALSGLSAQSKQKALEGFQKLTTKLREMQTAQLQAEKEARAEKIRQQKLSKPNRGHGMGL